MLYGYYLIRNYDYNFMTMISKKTLLSLALIICASFSGLSQSKSINLELLGASGMAGFNFDSRFSGNSGFGYSIGLGYGYSNSSLGGVSHELGVPLEINYLFGQGSSHLVLGAGAYAGSLFNEAQSKPLFVYNLFGDIAYRYQKPDGFTFSVGLKPNLNRIFWPYITLGYSF